jgi:Formyl transferase
LLQRRKRSGFLSRSAVTDARWEEVCRKTENDVPALPYRSVLICHRGASIDREGLARWLASFSDLVGIVELDEPPGRTWQRVRSQIQRSGWFRFLDVLAFRAWYRLTCARRDRAWEQHLVEAMRVRFSDAPAVGQVLRTTSVNAVATQEFLRVCQPDFVLARCKTLMKPDIFGIPARGTYVLHPGICPEYRNAHGCFWALARRDLERVGLTLLRVDRGIDTGPVYGYFSYPFDEYGESHVQIQLRMIAENLDAIRDLLLDAVQGGATPIETSGRDTATWGQPWLTAYLRWKTAARKDRHGSPNTALSRRGA